MKKIQSINPANGRLLGEVAASTPAEILEKVTQAQAAKSAWKALGVKERIRILKPVQALFKKNKNEIARLTTQEMGKPISESLADFEMDFAYLNDYLTNGANYLADEIVYRNKKAINRIVYEPRGVVASITPWNFPFGNFIWSVIPNLIVGNVVVFKHSEECPLVAKLLEELMLSLKGLPEGVFSAIYGDATEAQLLLAQPIDLIWFIGSSAVGAKLAALAGQKQIKAVLELGGSNPALILDNKNLKATIEKVYRGRFSNAGQVCDAIKRLLVCRPLFDQVVSSLSTYVRNMKIGDPENQGTQLGPLVSMRQLKALESQVADALDKGAVAVTGGVRPPRSAGAYFEPTILTQIKPNMRVWQEEVFGPVLPIVAFDDEEEAIQLANDTPYGLGAMIYSKNLAKARKLASRIDGGCIDINEGSHLQACTPFGGYKASGMGRAHGRAGFQELCQIKAISEA